MGTVMLFDLDHTLIHSSKRCKNTSLPGFPIRFEDGFERYVHVRPHALELVEYLVASKWTRIGFWTAGTRDYALAVVGGIFRLLGIQDWRSRIATLRSRDSAKRLPSGSYLKDVKKLSRTLRADRVWLFDDDPVHLQLDTNRRHIIPVSPFRADDCHADAVMRGVLDIARALDMLQGRCVRGERARVSPIETLEELEAA